MKVLIAGCRVYRQHGGIVIKSLESLDTYCATVRTTDLQLLDGDLPCRR